MIGICRLLLLCLNLAAADSKPNMNLKYKHAMCNNKILVQDPGAMCGVLSQDPSIAGFLHAIEVPESEQI